jgi:uncharacterized membrane protein
LWVTEFTNFGVVFGIAWNMTQKPGVASAIAAVVGGYVVGTVVAFRLIKTPADEVAAATEPVT